MNSSGDGMARSREYCGWEGARPDWDAISHADIMCMVGSSSQSELE